MLIRELIGNYIAKVYQANTGMPIWDPSIHVCYNDKHPRFNFHLELFLHLKWLSRYRTSDKNTLVLCEETRYHNYYQNIITCGPYGSHVVMLESDQLLFLTR